MTRPLHPGDEELALYADGALEGSAEHDVRAHLALCARCAEIVRAGRVGLARLATLSTPPSDLFERLRKRKAEGERAILPPVDNAPLYATDELPEVAGRDASPGPEDTGPAEPAEE
jgi:anti-sigma factor RsiW